MLPKRANTHDSGTQGSCFNFGKRYPYLLALIAILATWLLLTSVATSSRPREWLPIPAQYDLFAPKVKVDFKEPEVAIKDFEDYVVANNSNFDTQCGCKLKKPVDLNAPRSICSDHATSRGQGQKVIAYSFYGALKGGYFNGIRANLEGVQKYYPGYVMRLYHNLDKIDGMRDLQRLCSLFCETDAMDLCYVRDLATYGDISGVFGMLWRFAPMADGTVVEFHSRDLDSRISEREVAAVKDWDRTNKSFHVMRDNPYHVSHIMGGMFGMKISTKNFAKIASIFEEMLNSSKAKNWRKGLDQQFLSKYLWNKAKSDAVIHDSYLCKSIKSPNNRPWPTQRIPNVHNNFVGANGGILNKTCPVGCRPKEHKDWTLC